MNEHLEPSIRTLFKYIETVLDLKLREVLFVIADELNAIYLEVDMTRKFLRKAQAALDMLVAIKNAVSNCDSCGLDGVSECARCREFRAVIRKTEGLS